MSGDAYYDLQTMSVKRRSEPSPDLTAALKGIAEMDFGPVIRRDEHLAGERERATRIGKYKRFFPIAQAWAKMSRDPSTKVGAVVLGPNFNELSQGWNGAPRGCRAEEDERFTERSEKYRWVAHAEANAVYNAARAGHSLEGGVMLATAFPCMACAIAIVQSGISMVMAPVPDEAFYARWKEDIDRSRRLFAECGVYVVEIDATEKKE